MLSATHYSSSLNWEKTHSHSVETPNIFLGDLQRLFKKENTSAVEHLLANNNKMVNHLVFHHKTI